MRFSFLTPFLRHPWTKSAGRHGILRRSYYVFIRYRNTRCQLRVMCRCQSVVWRRDMAMVNFAMSPLRRRNCFLVLAFIFFIPFCIFVLFTVPGTFLFIFIKILTILSILNYHDCQIKNSSWYAHDPSWTIKLVHSVYWQSSKWQ